MTCIVAVPVQGGIIMGGDSAGVSGWDLVTRADEKVFRRGPFLIGFTSSFRMGQLIRYKLDVPPRDETVGGMEYMATTFVDAVRTCLGEGGWRKVSDSREEGGIFLVGYESVVYRIDNDFQVGCSAAGYAACGCGAEIALGALHATAQMALQAVARVEGALRAAEALSAGVRGPFVILDSRKAE